MVVLSPSWLARFWSTRSSVHAARNSTVAWLRVTLRTFARAISKYCAHSRSSVAERGEVLRLKRRLGFATRGEAESVIIVQADPLNALLPTLIVVPLDPAVGAYTRPLPVLRVSREETGSRVEHVAVPWRLGAVAADALAPGPVGRLRPDTLLALDDLLKLVLDLP